MSPAKRIAPNDDAEEILSPTDVDLDDGVVDVPATVVCALCGDPDCMGCAEERSRSGVISIVAWERPGPVLARLWWTAKAASENAEAFFEALPDGPVLPAFRFAMVAELLASSAMLLLLAGGLALTLLLFGIFPTLGGVSAMLVLRVALVAVAGLTGLLVAAHAVHGFSLDLGTRRAGVPTTSMTRALRYGLYAAGWDIMLGPIGFVVTLLREGPLKAFAIARLARRLPRRSSLAFLRGAYHIDAERAKPALLASYIGAAVATLVCAVIILGAIVAALVVR